MTGDTNFNSFPLARMSPLLKVLTVLLLALPVALIVATLLRQQMLAIPTAFLIALYAWVWVWFRPSRFVIHHGGVRVIWPLRHCEIPKDDISLVRVLGRTELRKEIGFGLRIGVGGLWGAFGWLWTTRRGLVRMYVSRTDQFVWIECINGKPWLITPEHPDEFVRMVSAASG